MNKGMTSTMSKVKENLISFFLLKSLFDVAIFHFWQIRYFDKQATVWVVGWVCNLVLFWHLQGRFDMWVMAP